MVGKLTLLLLSWLIHLSGNPLENSDIYQKINQPKNYFIEYGNHKIPAYLIENNQKKNLLVIGRQMDEEMGELILLQRPDSDGSGRIILPIQDENYHLEWIVPDAYKKAITSGEPSKFLEVIESIRPHIYPLITYLDIKNEVFNIHRPVIFLLKSLIACEQWDEAFLILSRVPYRRVNPIYLELAFKVLVQFVKSSQPTLAMQLFEKTFHLQATSQLQEQIMHFAYLLLQNHYPHQALYTYKKILKIDNFQYLTECRLWQAYCHYQIKQPELAKLFIEELGEFSHDKREFSLYLLIRSKLDLLEERYEDAIGKLSRAIVYAPIECRWLPELMHLTGNIYQKLGNIDASYSIHQEVALFFPKSLWAKKSDQIISRNKP